MARSSHELCQARAWAAAHKPKLRPRTVRLGRPANDNVRQTSLVARLVIASIGVVLLAFALAGLRFL